MNNVITLQQAGLVLTLVLTILVVSGNPLRSIPETTEVKKLLCLANDGGQLLNIIRLNLLM